MAKHIKTLLVTLVLMLIASAGRAALRVSPPVAKGHTEEATAITKGGEETASIAGWAGRKWEKLKKRIERKQAKWEKRRAKRKARRNDGEGGGIPWGSLSFILGLIFLVAGIILGIAAFSNPLGGFFHLLAGMLVVGGIVMILFAVLRASGT